MANKKHYAKNWIDQQDFTPEHDKLMCALLDNWKVLAMSRKPEAWVTKVDGKIIGEPSLEGYPPVFPDAIASGTFYGEHSETPLLYGHHKDPDAYYAHAREWFTIHCGVCEHQLETDKKWYSKDELREFVSTYKQRDCYGGYFKIVFEIKPEIKSFGEVLRQLNLYKERAEPSDIFLITPDERFDSQFEGQNIRVVHDLENIELCAQDEEPLPF